jgi:hypothetical protein
VEKSRPELTLQPFRFKAKALFPKAECLALNIHYLEIQDLPKCCINSFHEKANRSSPKTIFGSKQIGAELSGFARPARRLRPRTAG